ncbi:MAG: insulinase family protein [Ekhidna sp.]
MKKINVLLFAYMSFCVHLLMGQTSFDLNQQIPIDPSVKIGKLSNGLTYYLRSNEKPANKAELRLIVNVGSVVEDEDQLGLAHFVEHMAFNGTTNFEKNDLIDYLQNMGIEFGADLNAHTGFDETVYKLSIPTDNQEVFNTSLQILRDWADGITFSDEEIDNERGIVAEEKRARSGAGMRMYYQSIPILANNSRYAERSPIGTLDVIMNSEYDAMKRYYRDWYRPDLMALVLVGDFNVDEVEEQIQKIFKSLKSTNRKKRERIYYGIPENKEPAVAIITDPEATSVNASIYYKKEKKEKKTLQEYKTQVLQRLYTGMLRQRLSEVELSTDAPFLSSAAGIGSFLADKDCYFLRVNLKENNVIAGIEALLIESERARRHGFAASELERYKAVLLNNANTLRKETGKLSSRYYLEQYTDHFTDKRPIPGDEFNYNFYASVLPDITIEEVNQIGKKWIGEQNIAMVLNAPDKESVVLPNEEQLIKALKNTSTKEIAPYEDKLANVALMANKPEPGTIVETSYNHVVDATKWRFANGVTVIVKPTELQNDLISMSGFRPGGSSVAPDDLYVSARNASGIIGASGVNGISSIDLKKLNMGKTVRVTPYINYYDDLFRGSSSYADLERMLQLTHLYFTSPNKDQGVFESRKSKMIAITKNTDDNPNTKFEHRISEVMSQNHLRAVSLKEEQIEEGLKLDQVYEFYKERFSSANGFTFIFIGNFEVETLKAFVTQYLGSLPSNTEEMSTWKDIGLRRPEGIIKETVIKGIDDRSKVDMRFTGKLNYSLEERSKMTFLAKLLRIKLNEEMREKMSGVYGVQVSGFATDRPYHWYRMNVRFTCAPENIDALKSKVLEEIDKIKQNGPTVVDLEKIKKAELTNLRDRKKYNGYWESILKNAYVYDTNPEDALNAEQKIEDLSSEDLKNAANAYFDDRNYAEFILLPEIKK